MTYEQLQLELYRAIKDKNKVKENVIKEIANYVQNIAIEKKMKDNITEDIVNAAVMKAKKVCQEQIDTCPEERQELLDQYKNNMAYIDLYAPQMMNEDETRKAIYSILTVTDIFEYGKGAVMKAVMPKLKGKADGKIINKIVTEICQQSGECK